MDNDQICGFLRKIALSKQDWQPNSQHTVKQKRQEWDDFALSRIKEGVVAYNDITS